MEAHRMEAGTMLGGPLSGYACPVHLADLQLDPTSGELALRRRAAVGRAGMPVGRQAAELRGAAAGVQAALLQLLSPHGYSLDALGAHLEAQLEQLAGALTQQLPATEAGGSDGTGGTAGGEAADPRCGEAAAADGGSAEGGAAGGSSSGSGGGGGYVPTRLAALKQQVADLVAAVRKLLGVSDVLAEEAARSTLTAKLSKLLRAGSTDAGSGGAGDGANDAAAIEAALDGWTGERLLRAVVSLPVQQRGALLAAVPNVAVQMTALGVDLGALAARDEYRGPAGAAADAGVQSPRMPDVMGYRPASDEAVEAVAKALAALERGAAELRAHVHAACNGGGDGGGGASTSEPVALGAADVLAALALRRTYLSTDQMLGSLWETLRGEERGRPLRLPGPVRLRMQRVLREAGGLPYLERCLKYEEVMRLVQQGDTALARAGLQELEGSDARADAVLAALTGRPGEPAAPLDPEMRLAKAEAVAPRPADALRTGSWDL
eukprot:306833-Chlamydomonas_euryale.AAC.1